MKPLLATLFMLGACSAAASIGPEDVKADLLGETVQVGLCRWVFNDPSEIKSLKIVKRRGDERVSTLQVTTELVDSRNEKEYSMDLSLAYRKETDGWQLVTVTYIKNSSVSPCSISF